MKTVRVCLLGVLLCLILGPVTSTRVLSDDEKREAGQQEKRAAAELRERFEQLERQVRAAREAGNKEAVEKGLRELRELRERAQRASGDKREARGDEPKRGDGQRGEVPAEVRERLTQLKRRHDELREAGKTEEAEKVAREAREIMQRFARRGGDIPAEVRERLEELRRQIGKLREAGETEKAANLEREARAILARHGVSPGGQGNQRIEHLRVAAKHLREAGMNELAERVMAEIQRLRKKTGQVDRKPEASPRREEGRRKRDEE